MSLFASCENQNTDFPDFDYTAVYFAYQYPVRTIVLGEDNNYDTTIDNEHKCKIYATMGGVYSNNKRISIDVVVDNSLCNNLFFDARYKSPVQPMPSDYYTLATNQIILDHSLRDGVEVKLTDAFFADKKALENTYVIPLRMTNVINADSILSGVSNVSDPSRCNEAQWNTQPKDYVLYCLKFINPWHANYLRRGVDLITENGMITTNKRHQQYVEKDEVCNMYTSTLKSTVFPVNTKIMVEENGKSTLKTLTCNLILTFNNDNECIITSGTAEYSASGTGKFVKKGDKKSWGNKDRDVMYLDYKIDFNVKQYATKDTLVMRDRGVDMETFIPSYKVN